MDSDHADDDDAQEQAQAVHGDQDSDGQVAAEEPGQEMANNPDTIRSVSQAAIENRPDVLKRLIEEGKAVGRKMFFVLQVQDDHGWTALHHAAYLGHTECLRILVNEETCEIDAKASDGSTPLMAACASLPRSKECIKVLCEHKPDMNAINNGYVTALNIAVERMPDLKVVKWLVGSGAEVKNDGCCCCDGYRGDSVCTLLDGRGWKRVRHPAYDDEDDVWERFETDETEVAEVAKYFAKEGYVENALLSLVKHKSRIKSSHLLDEVIECFLENGAELDKHWKTMGPWFNCRTPVLTLFAQKSIINLEGLIWWIEHECSVHGFETRNAIRVLILQGMASGTLSLTGLAEMYRILKTNVAENDLLPLEICKMLSTMYDMTQNLPTLAQLARTKIRTQLVECGNFSRDNIMKLELPLTLKDFMQLTDLGEGAKVEEILEGTEGLFDWVDDPWDWSDDSDHSDD